MYICFCIKIFCFCKFQSTLSFDINTSKILIKASLLLYKPCPLLKIQNSATEVLNMRDRSIISLEHSYSAEDRLPGESVRITCHENFVFADGEKDHKVYKCLNDSTWSSEVVACVKGELFCCVFYKTFSNILFKISLFCFRICKPDFNFCFLNIFINILTTPFIT